MNVFRCKIIFHISVYGRFLHISFPSTFQSVEEVQIFLQHFNFWKISTLFFFFQISVCGGFPHRRISTLYVFLPHFSLWKISVLQFAKDFHAFHFLQHFSLGKISPLFFSFYSLVCRIFPHFILQHFRFYCFSFFLHFSL